MLASTVATSRDSKAGWCLADRPPRRQRRSEFEAKRRQWSKAADHVLQADLPAAWWNSQPRDHKLLSWPEPPGWMIRPRCSQSAPRIPVSCSARDGWRGWLAGNPRTTVRSEEKLGHRRRCHFLASKSLLLAHRPGHQEQCWQIGWRTLHRSTIGGRVQHVLPGTPQYESTVIRNFCMRAMLHTLVYVDGFCLLPIFVLSAKSTNYTKLNWVRKFLRLH